MAWHGMAWHGMAWHGMGWRPSPMSFSSRARAIFFSSQRENKLRAFGSACLEARLCYVTSGSRPAIMNFD
jgi:fructose-1,6-bisphosphatase/inositol monophosphatase family enzyme